MSDVRREKLQRTWAEPFREIVLPLIDENKFRSLYCPDNGSPNKSVRTIVALLILKEMQGLTFSGLIDSFAWDARYHYALDLPPEEAVICYETFYLFLRKIANKPQMREVFDEVTGGIIEAFALKHGMQRIDSTQIVSNMAHLGRLGLFVKTIEKFLRALQKAELKALEKLPLALLERYLAREGYFADTSSRKARRRLQQCAEDLWTLVDCYADDQRITGDSPSKAFKSAAKAYQLMRRLLAEQCEVDTDTSDEAPKVTLKAPSEVEATSLQNPSDPDATYSGHKGQGYQAQVVETCDGENPFQVITDGTVEGAHESDFHAALPAVERLTEKGLKPDTLFADTGYISGENIVACEEQGVALLGPVGGKARDNPERLTLADFSFSDDESQVLRCPAGHPPEQSAAGRKNENKRHAWWSQAQTCRACPMAKQCPTKNRKNRRSLTWTPQQLATAKRQRLQTMYRFKEQYRIRSGIEATFSENDRVSSLKHLRVRGGPAVTLVVMFKLLGCNVRRMVKYVQTTRKYAQSAANCLNIFMLLYTNVVYLPKFSYQSGCTRAS